MESTMAAEEFEDAQVYFEGQKRKAAGASDAGAAAEKALQKTEKLFPGFAAALERYESAMRERIDEIELLPILRKDGASNGWYSGPEAVYGEWPAYKRRLMQRTPAAVESVDDTTNRILTRCADPSSSSSLRGDKRKGLVIGFVQSGKTANYAGLIAKAVDAGYRIVIVLAGMHTNLRRQTQVRLETDLGMDVSAGEDRAIAWHELTGPDSDIGAGVRTGFLNMKHNVAVMVVKKHERRLANVAAFLHEINERNPGFLLDRPVLIIDDESDQATPNTESAKNTISTINKRIRAIWHEVQAGTYVAYTATPFANVFIDPSDEEDFYPEDFVVALPQPEGYLGAERFFDTSSEGEGPRDAIYELAREVPDSEASVLTTTAKEISSFEPEVTDSLRDALRWFIIATAVRRVRTGRHQHSSMLLHTSHLVAVHRELAEMIKSELQGMRASLAREIAEYKDLYQREISAASSLADGQPTPEWNEIEGQLATVLADCTVKIDNGRSDDRLSYPDDEPQTVIAVGGGTLSRGLTLEGLVVSYFLRTSNAYDTLLQMGRWFGFRPGYADLVRVWVGPGLIDDYAHLARVERELRDEVAILASEGRTPRELALRILAHPGRLEITSPKKMEFATLAKVGLGGTRRQTIYLDRSAAGALGAQAAVSGLVERLRARGAAPLTFVGRRAHHSPVLFEGVSNQELLAFLGEYWVSPNEKWLQIDNMRPWLETHGADLSWNVVLASNSGSSTVIELGGIELGTVSRTPLMPEHWSPERLGRVELPEGSDVVNIRALMAGGDQLLDLRILESNGRFAPVDSARLDGVRDRDTAAVRAARSVLAPEQGLLVIYPVDAGSVPGPDSPARCPMGGTEHLIGIGLVFPSVQDEPPGEYFAVEVQPELVPDEEPFDVIDDERDHDGGPSDG